jgi:hypothetical protein
MKINNKINNFVIKKMRLFLYFNNNNNSNNKKSLNMLII